MIQRRLYLNIYYKMQEILRLVILIIVAINTEFTYYNFQKSFLDSFQSVLDYCSLYNFNYEEIHKMVKHSNLK